MSFDSFKSKFNKIVDDSKEGLGIKKDPPPPSNLPPPPSHQQLNNNYNQQQQQPQQSYGYKPAPSQQAGQYGNNNSVSLNKTPQPTNNQQVNAPVVPNAPIRKFAPPTPSSNIQQTGQYSQQPPPSQQPINFQKQPSQTNFQQPPPIQPIQPMVPKRPAPPPSSSSLQQPISHQQVQYQPSQPINLQKQPSPTPSSNIQQTGQYNQQPPPSQQPINFQKQPSQTNFQQPIQPIAPKRPVVPPSQPISHQQAQYQPSQQPMVSLEKKSPNLQSFNSSPQNNNGAGQYHSPQYNNQQLDGASLEKRNDKSFNEQLPESLKKHTDIAKTHSNIALTSIGVQLDDVIKANIPPLYLNDPMYLSNIQYTEIILDIEKVSIKPINYGEKFEAILKDERLIIYKTLIDDTIIIQLGHIYIYTNLKEKPCFRAYPHHYIIADNFNNFFMIKVDKHTNEESLNKLEVILTYYTTYYRVPPKKEEYKDETAKKMENASGKVEKASLSIQRGLISGGTYFAKGASKIGEVYKNNTKKYEGPEMTEEQRREIEDPNSKLNKEGKNSEKMAQGTASVQKGITQGFGWVGSKISQGVHSTDWYKEREAKKKEEERLNGKNEKKEAGSGMASTGVGALKNIWGGLEEGVLISARGVRDASVDAKRHTSGDYEAEKSRKKWDSAGNATISVVNIVSLLSVTWIKGALYVGAGALSYDVDQVSLFSKPNAYWKAGWLTTRSDLLSGSKWSSRWVVLRNASFALYASPNDPPEKPIIFCYLNKIRGVTKIPIERSHRPYCFDVVTSDGAISLSALTESVDYSDESIQPNPEDEVIQWSNSILSVSTFIGDLKDNNNK